MTPFLFFISFEVKAGRAKNTRYTQAMTPNGNEEPHLQLACCWALLIRRLTACSKNGRPEQAFAPHNMQYKNARTLFPIKNSARWLDDLSVPPALEFLWFGTTLRMISKLTHMSKHALDQNFRRVRIVQGDVVGDCIKVAKRRIGPNYFSHRFMRFLACA